MRRLRRPGKIFMAWSSHPFFTTATCEIAGLITRYLGALIFIFLLHPVAVVSCLGAFLSDLHQNMQTLEPSLVARIRLRPTLQG